ncbi:MAG: trypsin-like serine protease [Thermoleophilia bacterium]
MSPRPHPRRKLAVVAAAAGAAALALTGAAQAILGGVPDGEAHPYVGLVDVGDTICTGFAVSPTVVVTAAHCFDEDDDTRATVTFAEDASDPDVIVEHPGSWTVSPAYDGLGADDLAVVVLDEPVSLPRLAQLPEEGAADALPRKAMLTLVGYGLQDDGSAYTRETTTVRVSTPDGPKKAGTLKLHDGKTGFCFGDSGGPDLQGDVALGVNSALSSKKCKGPGFSARLDTPSALGFVQGFLGT